MKYLILVCLICHYAQSQTYNIKTRPSLKLHLNKYSKNRLIENLRKFVRASRPSRLMGTPGHKKAVGFILDQIKSAHSPTDLLKVETFLPDIEWAEEVYEKDFQKKIASKYSKNHTLYKKWRYFTDNTIRTLRKYKKVVGKNIIWEKQGTDPQAQMIIIGAHYDNVVRDPQNFNLLPLVSSEGANDNASSVAVCLGLIEVLQKIQIKNTVRVVFFDYEELGFLGSKAYADKHLKGKSGSHIFGMVNLEMLGQDSINFDKQKKLGNFHAYTRKASHPESRKDLLFAQNLISTGSSITTKVRFALKQNGWDRSDHIHFWEQGIPALVFTQNWDDDFNYSIYHSPHDIVEALNFNTLYNSFQFIAGAITAWSLKI